MPVMARRLAHPLVAGLLLAAPYAAIMSTVAAFLLMISSSLVRDLYQRTLNPNVSERTVKRASYLVTALVGVVVTLGAVNPPGFLQYLIVFTGTGARPGLPPPAGGLGPAPRLPDTVGRPPRPGDELAPRYFPGPASARAP